jgi:hypothetical protein
MGSLRFGIFTSRRRPESLLNSQIDADIAEWIQNTQEAVKSWQPSSLERQEDDHFPLAQLKLYTDAFLRKRGSLSADQRSSIFTQLIVRHTQKNVAFLACAHGFSTEAARAVLEDFQINTNQPSEVIDYLRVVSYTRFVDPQIIDELDIQCSEILLSLSTADPQKVGPRLEASLILLSAGPPSLRLLHSLIDDVLRKAYWLFSTHLENLSRGADFGQAYAACAWLSKICETPELIAALNKLFPKWHTWAVWRPNCARLRRWESLAVDQRRHVYDLLSLDGPDVLTGKMGTLREGLSFPPTYSEIRYGSLIIKVRDDQACDPLRLLDQLLDTLADCVSESPNSIVHIKQMFVEKPVTYEDFHLLQAAKIPENSFIRPTVLEILSSQVVSVQTTGISKLLPALGTIGKQGDELRELISPLLVSTVDVGLKSFQEKFSKKIQGGKDDVEVIGMKVAHLAHTLKNAAWLRLKLHQRIQHFLDRLAPLENFKALLKLRDAIRKSVSGYNSSLIRAVDDYCISEFTDLSITDDETKIIKVLLQFWIQPPDRERREAALVIARQISISSRTRSRCISQLQDAPEKLLTGVRLINKTDIACVRFARILSSPKVYGTGLDECWQHLLQTMIENQGPRIGENVLDQIGIEDWFRWQNDLRKIFFQGNHRPTIEHLTLDRRLSRWFEHLSTKYLSPLKRIEATGQKSQLRWLVFSLDERETVNPLLYALDLLEPGPLNPVIHALLMALEPDCGNAKLVTDALLRMPDLLESGTQVCLRAINLYNTSSGKISENSIFHLMIPSDLTKAEVRALGAIVAVLVVCLSLCCSGQAFGLTMRISTLTLLQPTP